MSHLRIPKNWTIQRSTPFSLKRMSLRHYLIITIQLKVYLVSYV
ncbi:hypothetical protein SAMN04488136_11614 [Vibrio xiamenensis]|uniref:Uncharacterized protein n=1 Tax=Vibrio xiamenensis TaxID=861298 RepID=A0A1G8CDU3_9VIBR|nr:hypothetical protein SAMN04488136_11614 [Vibrio xiamenensis]